MTAHSATAAHVARPWPARLHPGLFSIPLGLMGLAGAWQRMVPLGVTIGNPISLYLFAAGLGMLTLLLALWCVKALFHPAAMREEWSHPVAGALLAMAPVGVLLAISLLAPLLPQLAAHLLAATLGALALQAICTWQVVARLSTGQMAAETVTPAPDSCQWPRRLPTRERRRHPSRPSPICAFRSA